MHEWTWHPDDFASLWRTEFDDVLPRHLLFGETRRDAERGATPAFAGAVGRLARSDMRVEIRSFVNRSKRGPDELRIIGAREPGGAVILVQSVTDGVAGHIRVLPGSIEGLPPGLVARLPRLGPGRGRPLDLQLQDLIPRRPDPRVLTTEETRREEYRRLMDRPMLGNGTAALYLGGLHARPSATRTLWWDDFCGDGRYLREQIGEHLRVRAADAQDVARHFHRWFELGVRREQELRVR